MPNKTPDRPAAPRSGAGVLTLLAVLAFVVLGAFLLMRGERPVSVGDASPPPAVPTTTTTLAQVPPSTEPPAPSAEPTTVAPAGPVASPPATVAGPAPAAPRPRRRPPASPAPPQVAEAAPPPGRMDPGAPPPPPGSVPRRFVLGATRVESLKKVGRDVQGFDVDGVGVKRAPDVNGRVEMEMTPREVHPGVDYLVKVFLANDGDKDIPVQDLKVATVVNGTWTSENATPGAKVVKPRQRLLLHEAAGVWREVARSWAMEVTVTSARQDVYRNRLSWQ